MAQENNTAREQTELEKLSQDALNQARRERKMIQDTCIAELAQCDTEIPEALEKQVQAEIASLQQAKENLSSAHKIASSTVDELSARAADVAKSLNRKWYRINPPSNTAIDVQEEEKSFFARGMNGYKIALIVLYRQLCGRDAGAAVVLCAPRLSGKPVGACLGTVQHALRRGRGVAVYHPLPFPQPRQVAELLGRIRCRQRRRIRLLVAAGGAFRFALVGLQPRAVQHQRANLPAVFAILGCAGYLLD